MADAKMILIRCEEMDLQIRAKALDHNKKVFDWFCANFPTRYVLSATVVAGLQVYFQKVPMLNTECNWIQEDCLLEYMHEYPVGTFMAFMCAGNVANMTIKAGEQTEPMCYPTFARVIDEDIPVLLEMGRRIWEDQLMNKKVFHADLTVIEEN